MRLFGLETLNLLAHDWRVRQVHTSVQTFLKPYHAPLDGFVHLLGLSASTAEHQNPTIFTELFPQRLSILFQLFVVGI